ncbi:MAG: hypothetical protein ACE5J9_00270 [Methanosarcinales archaeon]
MVNVKFDLKQLLEYFSDIGEKRWGQTLQLEVLEKVFIPVKEGNEEFSLKHLKAISNDCSFANWWKMPEIREKELTPLKSVFTKLKPCDKKVIGKLFDLLKDIEIVSCVLRSIDPLNYGIMSPPVENILNVKGKDKKERYINYLQNLEELKEAYNFERIADVDMALWALANIIYYSDLRHHPVYSDIYDAYEQTANPIKKIMARNSLEQIKEEQPLYKAELFLDSDYIMAGLIAGRELDIFVKDLCRNNGIKLVERTKRVPIRYLSVSELIDRLFSRKVITREEKELIDKWWEHRCDLTHEGKISTSSDDIQDMIVGISKLKKKYLM